MESHLHDWLSLLTRWAHMITGIAWIGASFYFNWLENHLQRTHSSDGIAGDLWAVHGGGFYYLQKFEVAPSELPPALHWFKWEAYFTWITGMALLGVVYYWEASLFMIDPAVSSISNTTAILTGLVALFSSWLIYDLLCRSSLSNKPLVLSLIILAWFTGLAWGLSSLLSARAAYIHTGAAIGTIMVANVFRVIIPAQKELVSAMTEGRTPDASKGKRALQRSRHNNYFTLPVLFIMISSHHPMTYGHPLGWLVLLILAIAGVAIRHYFNIRHLPGNHFWALGIGLGLITALILWTKPTPPEPTPISTPSISTATAWSIVQKRCVTCHASEPGHQSFASAPLGIELDSTDKLRAQAERVYTATVISRTMPLGNLTQMTEQERSEIAWWFEAREREDQ